MTQTARQQQSPILRINPLELVRMDDFAGRYPLRTDLVYAQADHPENMFKTAIYRKEARLWMHYELVPVVLRAAELCFREKKYVMVLKDCLRTVEAQQKISETDIVRAHPQWLEGPVRFLSPPGAGAHPRAMAIDIALVTENGDAVDMGTPFDYLPPDLSDNPSARDYAGTGDIARANRRLLDTAMAQAATEAGHQLLPLPQEWWDFRFYPDYYGMYHPLSDSELPPDMRMTYA